MILHIFLHEESYSFIPILTLYIPMQHVLIYHNDNWVNGYASLHCLLIGAPLYHSQGENKVFENYTHVCMHKTREVLKMKHRTMRAD